MDIVLDNCVPLTELRKYFTALRAAFPGGIG
jgi:hypothetical protein